MTVAICSQQMPSSIASTISSAASSHRWMTGFRGSAPACRMQEAAHRRSARHADSA